MFLRAEGGYTRDGQQWSRGPFLLVFDDYDSPERIALDNGRTAPRLYAIVRHARLSQLGHFMMGTVRIADCKVTISGAYGSDGLPMDMEKLTPRARALLVPVPDALARIFWSGGGHNAPGKEAVAMRRWATS
jgi:hypothetical protein